MKRALRIAALLLALAAAAYLLLRPPSPEQILAALRVPPAPALEPEAERASFRLAPGFRIELVAAEPLVVAPVAVAWDDAGRLYAVEMRGFMPNLAGEGEDAPSGRVVVLEDLDADGRMDRSHVLRDGLVLPRALAVLPEGVLIAAPPDLWLCPPFEREPRCTAPLRLGPYALGRHDPEHAENGLLPGLDGWLYNAKSERRLRLERDARHEAPTYALREERTAFRGQWGIAQDDEGRLFTNHNSAFLFVDLFPAEYLARHPATDPRTRRPGLAVALASGASVHGVRVAPGLNRAYLPDVLRRDGRQNGPTAVSGLALNRADAFGPEARGDVFVAEPASNVVARFRVHIDGLDASAEQLLTPDPEFGEREFLASSDERFRPVNLAFGPDGALTVVDMYRGVIQHANYLTDYLRAYVQRQGLEAPLDRGRIWRVVRENAPGEVSPDASRASTAERIALLDHPNGWVRDRAQRWLVSARDPDAATRLRELGRLSPRGRLHALSALAELDALDDASLALALADSEPAVRRAGLRAGEVLLRSDPRAERIAVYLAARSDADPAVRLQALHSLGEVPPAARPLAALLAAAVDAPEDALVRQAVVSGLAGLELGAIDAVLSAPRASEAFLRELGSAAALAAAADAAQMAALLDRIHALPAGDERQLALASGVAAVLRRPAGARLELAAPHPLLAPVPTPDAPKSAGSDAPTPAVSDDLARVLRGIRRGLTWPGDTELPGARPLTPAEERARAAGAALYAESCAACHGQDGRGQPGLAPGLAGSPWVLDAEGWLVRVALHGLTGPLRVGDETWDLAMPGFAADPRFGDEALAGLLTYVRRAWGNTGEPIAEAAVAAIRRAEAARTQPFRAEELLALDVAHRLDRYAGTYGLPVVTIELAVERRGDRLFMGVTGRGGMGELAERADGSFASEDPEGGALVLEFEEDDAGVVTGVTMVRGGGERIPWSRN
jgi:putative membrane-bound dehydrogenase-like protein